MFQSSSGIITVMAGCGSSMSSGPHMVGAPTWIPATNKQEFFTTRQLIIERVERVTGQ